ncbi:heat shock protein 9/12-domain-containing protein [Naematelia encephala]|uniref:Heat shock protein 9/12-domain-containing protein n=1 Tax=Naematelia encephala TaxID=71784 RepID=A0A1Y2BF03_9TREE|nr:heat shock protein 9/12-domain-containing protein [Naematelia encephala]
MSDTGRQSLGDKAEAAVKPDSQKTYLEQGKDMLAGKSDSAASSAQPDSQKSTTQSIGDSLSGNSNENSDSLMNKAKDTLGMQK